MAILDRDVIPSSLQVVSTPQTFDGDNFHNIRLRMGEVQAIIYPDDDNSRTKRLVEYSVLVQHRANGTVVTTLYGHCILSNLFGGLADQLSYTLRREDKPNTAQKKMLGLGAKVLIACLNGATHDPVIIGGLRDPQDDDKKSKDLKHHFHFLWNGIGVDINDDGEITLKYNGKTKIDGKGDSNNDSKAVGSSVSMTKDGNITVQSGDGKEALVIDNKNQQVVIKHQKGVLIGQATDKMLLGERHRKAQKQMHAKLKQMIDGAGKALQAAGTSMTSAGASMATPIAGAVAAGPQITAAATAIITASQLLAQAAQAIDAFENGDPQNDYLSGACKND